MADQITTSLAQAKVLVMHGMRGEDGKSPYIGQNGNWIVWNGTDWVDTGVAAGVDESTVAAVVEDYLDEHPVQVEESDPTVPAWAKNPTKPTYTANEVGAMPADTPIPAAVTEQTVAGWGFTKNTGTYSKPSGGIPASDLADGVIPVVPQMATQADMSDWTQGKTVDASALKTDFQSAVQNLTNIGSVVNAHTGDIIDLQNDKAGKTEIPTKTSDLTNDSGYQTAAQVQTCINDALAAIPYAETEAF